MNETRSEGDAEERPKDSIWDIVLTIVYALLIALAFRTILFQPFSIPSGSMKSTLLVGDYIFVSKSSYGYSRYSLPYGHMLPSVGRILSDEPERGDVIVFKHPRDGEQDYIKRLVGLPGDRIRTSLGRVYINGVELPQERVEPFIEPRSEGRRQNCVQQISNARFCGRERFIETMPNGVSYMVLNSDSNLGRLDNMAEFTVPEGEYFFMGDNRDNSADSRSDLGTVPFEYLVGRADIVLLSSSGAFWQVWEWRGDRFFTWID